MANLQESHQQMQLCDVLQSDGTHCRAVFPKGCNFCPECGGAAGRLLCKSCGDNYEPNWKFCGFCGTRDGGVRIRLIPGQ